MITTAQHPEMQCAPAGTGALLHLLPSLRPRDTMSVPDRSAAGRAPFAMVPESLLDDDKVSDRSVRVWGLLARYANEAGQCWPSRTTLAKRLRCGTATVDRALANLISRGWISKRVRRKGGRYDSTVYTLNQSSRVMNGKGSPVITDDEGVVPPVMTEREPLERKPTTAGATSKARRREGQVSPSLRRHYDPATRKQA
ncbi:MAG: helix-turn-helix domain-containing protein [Planctomycetes bacterium]|nr:helix-turn-helix domain-containing protein [Planctomycetota bacterium]